MNKNIFETMKKELRAIVRDQKSLIMMLVTPILIPIFIFLFSFLYNEMMYGESVDTYIVAANYQLNSVEKEIIKDLNLEISYYSSQEEMQEEFENNNIDAYIMLDNGKYSIYSNNKAEFSSMAGYNLSLYLDSYNNYLAQHYLYEIDADLDKVYNNIQYDFVEIEGQNDLVNTIINLGFVFAIMSITLVAIYGATDSTAGEKERGTLETFLTFPIKSNEIITGKYLAISLSCIITSVISTTLTVSALVVCSNMFEIYQDTIINLNVLTISLGILIMVSYSLFISGLCIAISSFSKTYKEAQSALTPLSMAIMVPMFLDMFGVKMTPLLSLVPVLNHTLILNEMFCGTINILNVIIMFISTIIYVIFIIYFITKQYKSEKILFSI